jgi:hypothetical protein
MEAGSNRRRPVWESIPAPPGAAILAPSLTATNRRRSSTHSGTAQSTKAEGLAAQCAAWRQRWIIGLGSHQKAIHYRARFAFVKPAERTRHTKSGQAQA